MFGGIDRHVLFHEIHRSIEESATVAVEQLMAGSPDLTYPPNHGLTPDEAAALESIPKTPEMERALRKVVASAAAGPLFRLFCLVDGVADPPVALEVEERDRLADLPLHDGLFESYWAWRRRRLDPGWKLDTYEGE